MNKIKKITKELEEEGGGYTIYIEGGNKFEIIEDDGAELLIETTLYVPYLIEDRDEVQNKINDQVAYFMNLYDILKELRNEFPHISPDFSSSSDDEDTYLEIEWTKEDWNEVYNKYKDE